MAMANAFLIRGSLKRFSIGGKAIVLHRAAAARSKTALLGQSLLFQDGGMLRLSMKSNCPCSYMATAVVFSLTMNIVTRSITGCRESSSDWRAARFHFHVSRTPR